MATCCTACIQVINNKSDQPFGELEIEGAAQLCKTLATAIRQRMQKEQESQRRRATKYDGLLADGVLTQEELQKCIARAREEGKPVEHVLMGDYQIRPAQIGPSLARFFGVPYEPFNAGRIRSEQLQGPLKRDFVEEQGWIPLEESPDGLVVMCMDPEAVRGSRIVPQVFPRHSQVRVPGHHPDRIRGNAGPALRGRRRRPVDRRAAGRPDCAGRRRR